MICTDELISYLEAETDIEREQAKRNILSCFSMQYYFNRQAYFILMLHLRDILSTSYDINIQSLIPFQIDFNTFIEKLVEYVKAHKDTSERLKDLFGRFKTDKEIRNQIVEIIFSILVQLLKDVNRDIIVKYRLAKVGLLSKVLEKEVS